MLVWAEGARAERADVRPADDLYAVSTPDGETVVAVGAHGTILRSDDGGSRWLPVPSPVDSTLTSVSLSDARRGWAVGMHGVLLRTEDGGASWTRQPLPEDSASMHLLGVHAIDGERALAVGTWGARLRTEDGGRQWRDDPVSIGPEHARFAWLDPAERARLRQGGSVREDVALQGVTCRPDGERCALVGEFGTLQRSDDGGRSWSPAEIDSGVAPVDRAFAAGAVALPLDDVGELSALVSELARAPAARLEIEAFVGRRELASGPGPASLLERLDARLAAAREAAERAGAPPGQLREVGRPPWEASDFGVADPEALRRYLEARRAERPGVRWTLRLRPLLYAVALGESEAWAVGLGGRVLVSRDGARRWSPLAAPADRSLYAASVSPTAVWLAGEGGALWSPQSGAPSHPAQGRFLRDLAFARNAPDTGFAVGEGGLVLRSRDGGRSWQRVAP